MKMFVFQWFRCFVGSPPIWGLFLASCWLLAGFLLASCWLLAGFLLASCWRLAGLLLASSWPLAGPLASASFKLRHEDFSRKSVFQKAPKLVNSLHGNACFSMVSVFRGVPPIWGLFLASCWLLAGLLLASCWLLPGLLLASPPEHPAKAPRKSIPPEHPARASRSPYRRFAQKNVRALALRASGGSRDVCLAVRNKSPPSWLLAGFPARASRQKIGFSKSSQNW